MKKRNGFWGLLRWLWNWSLWVTLPISIVFLVWANRTGQQYWNFGVRYDLQNGQARVLHPLMGLNWELIKAQAKPQRWFSTNTLELDQLHLLVPDGSLQALDASLPASGREYVRGGLLYPGGSVMEVDLRYRGDMFWHWAYPKKSWRIKTKKQALWHGARKWNLIVPETEALSEAYFSSKLSEQLGLLTPRTEMREVWINGHNRGVYTLIEQLDEQFLRSNLRMPGDLYAGELFGRDFYSFEYNNIFALPGVWTKAAINNHFDGEASDPLDRLCEVLAWPPGPEKTQALGQVLDIEAFARFAAFRTLCQTRHFDPYHNWRLYYDPWRNRFEPIVWDPAGWNESFAPGKGEVEFDLPAFTNLDRVLALDQRYRWAAHLAMVEAFENELDRKILEQFDATQAELRPAAERDPALIHFFKRVDSDAFDGGSQRMRDLMQRYFAVARDRHVASDPKVVRGPMGPGRGVGLTMPITLDGYQPIHGLRIEFAQALPAGLRVSMRMEGSASDAWKVVEARVDGNAVVLDVPLLPGVEDVITYQKFLETKRALLPRPVTYWLWLTHNADLLPFPKRTFALVSVGEPFEVPEVALDSFGDRGQEVGILFEAREPPPTHWQGEVALQGLTEIRGELSIEPGTVVHLAPGASLILHGKLTAVGSAEKPIEIRGQTGTTEPWGTFALRTQGANGSRLEHVRFSGGSGLKQPLQEYSAMFSVHGVDNVRMLNCHFENGQIVDDMVHVVYAKDLYLESCTFENSLSDALDLDACEARLVRCHFSNSGNDAVDLMMSQVEMIENSLVASGDKGVSVGEGSELLLVNSELSRCVFGVQVKDGSVAWVRDCEFRENGTALDAYQKNWQYGAGGHGLVQDCSFSGSGTRIQADKNSSWLAIDAETQGWEGVGRVWWQPQWLTETQWPGKPYFEAAGLWTLAK